jgi:hypothetical protein
MSKGILYSLVVIFGILFVSLFAFLQPVYLVPILRFLGIIFLPIVSAVILVHIFRNKQTTVPKYSILNILLTTFKIVAVCSLVFSAITFLYLLLVGTSDVGVGGLLPIGIFAVVTIPSSIAYLILYLIKVAKSKN